MSEVQKISLKHLNTQVNNALVIGIVIAKNCPRTIILKNNRGESRVMFFTIRDSESDTINVDVWGSDYFVNNFYDRFRIGDVVEINSPQVRVKNEPGENFRPQVSSPYFLRINKRSSGVRVFDGDSYITYLPLLHIPSKPSAGYLGLAEVMNFREENGDVYVDLLVVVKSVEPVKTIKSKRGKDVTLLSVEIVDNTMPASLCFDIFDIATIQRADEWRPLDSVLFIADARLYWRNRSVRPQTCYRTVITHQPDTSEAKALKLCVRDQAGGGEATARATSPTWIGQRVSSASVEQVRNLFAVGAPFCVSLHAMLTRLDLEDLIDPPDGNCEELKVHFTDHSGALSARLPTNILQETFGYTAEQLKALTSKERSAMRWRLLLERCWVQLAATPPRLIVLSLRRATPE